MRTLEATLLAQTKDSSLVAIGRERRLVLEDSQGARRVDLCWVDEVILALVSLACERDRSLTLLYPAPAGSVSALLAAQLLVDQFVGNNLQASVGIVTADPSMASATWNSLQFATTGARARIAEIFPSYRADPEGDSPWGGRRLRGVIIGPKCRNWPVQHLIVDRLAGLVHVDTEHSTIELVTDPGDSALSQAQKKGRLIWGWSSAHLRAAHHLEERIQNTLPFSVAHERLDTIAEGVGVQITVAAHPQAEEAVARIREDLRLLRTMAPDRNNRNLERGLSAAWRHLSTLTSLPCSPSRFDQFAGYPPVAARATHTFAPELASWAETLEGDYTDVAGVLASDIADLRAELDLGNPFEESLRQVYERQEETLIITRTATAAKALQDLLGHTDFGKQDEAFIIRPIRRLHRLGSWPQALVVGEPAPWEWPLVLGGIAPKLEILSLGRASAEACASSVVSAEARRNYWGGENFRNSVWRALVGRLPHELDVPESVEIAPVVVLEGAEYVPEPDPFSDLAELFELDPLDIGEEGPTAGVAREDESGNWSALAPAVSVQTDRGQILLEQGRPVDVKEGPRIVEKSPEELRPGAILLVGRRRGRVGLIEALEDRLNHRPDLLAASYLIEHYHRLLRDRFRATGWTVENLHNELRKRGCSRVYATVMSWVNGATMAPQQFADLQKLCDALSLGLSQQRLRELFAGVERRRAFRRAAGRMLADAAREAMVVQNPDRVDPGSGLSIADLREAIIDAEVISVTPCDQLMPLTLLGRLED